MYDKYILFKIYMAVYMPPKAYIEVTIIPWKPVYVESIGALWYMLYGMVAVCHRPYASAQSLLYWPGWSCNFFEKIEKIGGY